MSGGGTSPIGSSKVVNSGGDHHNQLSGAAAKAD
jgi:hypothetical protein